MHKYFQTQYSQYVYSNSIYLIHSITILDIYHYYYLAGFHWKNNKRGNGGMGDTPLRPTYNSSTIIITILYSILVLQTLQYRTSLKIAL